MRQLLLCSSMVLMVACAVNVAAQTWPDFHLTNGTYYASYGVQTYDASNPHKNLYIDPYATLRAGSTELDDIYDGNQVFLSGGTVYAAAIDAADFTWINGTLHLNGGTHSTTYGLGSGTGKNLYVDAGATVQASFGSALPAGNQLTLNDGGILSVNDFDAAMNGFSFNGGTLAVAGALSGMTSLTDFQNLKLVGSNAVWNTAGGIASPGAFYCSVIVAEGGQLTTGAGNYLDTSTLEVSGTGSMWESAGNVELTYNSTLRITNAGAVSVQNALVGNGWDSGNDVIVAGQNSSLQTGTMAIGSERSDNNTMTISAGGVVNSTAGIIGGQRGSSDNVVEVTGDGSQWNNSEALIIGDDSWQNELHVLDGGIVTSVGGTIGSSLSYHVYDNQVSVSGAGSRWINYGSLGIGDSDAEGNTLLIANGGEVVVQGGITIAPVASGALNGISVNDGGRLTVGSDFDASQQGFFLNSGGALSVHGQLSGLSLLAAGCRLEASDVLGDLTVHGILAPGSSPADSVVDGVLTLGPDGTLEMEIGGTSLGTEYDRLTVTGNAELDGTLDIVLLNGYEPAYGDSFDLFDWIGGATGGFSATNAPSLSGGLYWDTSSLYSTGQISVIPEPSVLSLILVFGWGGWVVRRYFPPV